VVCIEMRGKVEETGLSCREGVVELAQLELKGRSVSRSGENERKSC
jgi:hypothetical protein